MPKSYADEQKRKKDEEERQQAEQKVVGQQQKTQPEANKPTGSTSIPTTPAKEQARAEQRQREQQRLENKTPERQARINYNRQQQAQTSTRDTENAKVQNRNERRENTVNRNVTERQAYTDTNSNNRDLRSNAQKAADRRIDRVVPGYSRSMGAANSQYAPNRQTSQRTQSIMQNYGGNGQTVGGGTIQRLPSPSDLPDAVGSSSNQLDLSKYTFGKPSDFSGATIGSRKNAEDDLYNILHGNKREADKERARNDSNPLLSLLAGAGSGALGTLGDLAGISEKYFKGKPNDYEGMTPDDIYNRAVETANGMNLLNYNNATLGSDYDAYKDYILKQMETGDITNDEINKMKNLEKLYSEKIPAKGLKELGADARAINEGFAEENPISNFAGNMAPMVLANGVLSALGVGSEALAAADKINNPALKFLAKQGVNLIPDLITDTGSEMVRNINEGKSKEEIAKDAALNVLMNAGANVAFDYAPKGIKAIADRVNGSNVAKQATEEVAERAAKEAIPNLAEQTIKGITDPYSDIADELITPSTLDDVIGKNVAPEIDEIGTFGISNAPKDVDNLIRNNGFRNILRDSEYAKLADIGGKQGPLDDALGDVIRAVESGDKSAYNAAMDQYRQIAEASGIDADRILNRLDRYVIGEISEDLDTELVNSITQNIDVIDAELKKLDAIGVPPTKNGSDWLAEAHRALDEYENAVFDGGDAKAASDNLNRILGNLDTQAKKLEGYDGAFSSWKGGGTARGDLYSNSSRIPGYGETDWTDDMINELNDVEDNYHAKPANQNVTPSEVPTAESLPKADTNVPNLDSPTPKNPVDRGPEGRMVDTNDVKERGYAKSTRNNPDIPDEVAAEFVENPEIYNVLHNKDTKEKAQAILDQGFDKAYADYKDLLNKKDPSAIPLGYDLAKQMIDKGDSSGAAELIRDMSKSLTESGQFSQAAAITLMRNDPMTALKYAQKEMDKLNTEGAKKFKNWKNFELTDAEIKAFSNLKAGDKEGISKLFDQIGVRLGKEYPTTTMEKLLEARRIGMLFNVRTNVRNFGANIPTLGMRWASDRVDAVGQNIAHLIDPNFKVTQSLTGSGRKGRKLATEIFNSDRVQNLIKGTDGKYTDSIKGALGKEKQMYKGTALDHWIDKVTGNGLQRLNEKAFGKKGVQSIPETIRNATYKALDLGDSPFVKENFIERLGSYIKAQGYKSIDDVPDEAVETAWEAAMKATYKDESWAYKMIRDIKEGIGQAGKAGKVASESLIPFVQAPGNIAARMVDYSPIGGANGVKSIIKGAKSGSEKTVREGINQLAQGATGTLAFGIGVALYNSGLITGAYSQDKDKKSHEKNNGYREYALHIGDHYYTIDWAQPAFQTIMNGVVLADAIKKSDEYDSDMLKYFGVENSTAGKVIGAAKQAGKTSLNSWFNASPLQSMQDLLGGTYEDSSDIASKLWSVAGENFAGSYIPASVNAVAKTMDTTQRQTYDPSNKTASFVNQQIAKIPGLSKTLPSKYNTWGEEIKTAGSRGEAAFNRFLNPGEGTTENKKPIDVELDRLFDTTGNKQVYPQVAPNKVNNEALTARQVSDLQKDMGERSLDAANKFMDSDVYQNMTDEQRAEGYADLYNTAKWAAQLKMTDPELYEQMQAGDVEALKTLSGTGASLKKKYIAEGWDAVIDDIAYGQMKGQIDTDGSGSVNQDEILNFINDGHQDEAEKIWNKYKGNSNSQLQTDENGVYTLMDSKGKVKYGTGSMSDEEKAITNELDELGFTSDKAYEQYTKAQSVIPTLTTQEYADTYNSMDADKSNSINQKEMFAFFKSNNVTQEEANQYWQAYGNDWKTVPVLEGDEWKAKKGTIETAPEETAATDDYSGGSVDIHNRPLVPTSELKAAGWNDAGDGYATVFSSTYSNADETDVRNFTPIMVDDNGQYVQTVSPDFLKSYAEEVIDGKHSDYYGLQIGGSYSSVKDAVKAAEKLHEDQEKEYGLAQKQEAEELPGAEELPSAEPVNDGGLNWALSNGYDLKNTKTYQRAVDAGVSDADFNAAWFAADADGNGYMKKAEAQNYVSGLPEEERDKWFHILYKGR